MKRRRKGDLMRERTVVEVFDNNNQLVHRTVTTRQIEEDGCSGGCDCNPQAVNEQAALQATLQAVPCATCNHPDICEAFDLITDALEILRHRTCSS